MSPRKKEFFKPNYAESLKMKFRFKKIFSKKEKKEKFKPLKEKFFA
jgi:hypothetical protein